MPLLYFSSEHELNVSLSIHVSNSNALPVQVVWPPSRRSQPQSRQKQRRGQKSSAQCMTCTCNTCGILPRYLIRITLNASVSFCVLASKQPTPAWQTGQRDRKRARANICKARFEMRRLIRCLFSVLKPTLSLSLILDPASKTLNLPHKCTTSGKCTNRLICVLACFSMSLSLGANIWCVICLTNASFWACILQPPPHFRPCQPPQVRA